MRACLLQGHYNLSSGFVPLRFANQHQNDAFFDPRARLKVEPMRKQLNILNLATMVLLVTISSIGCGPIKKPQIAPKEVEKVDDRTSATVEIRFRHRLLQDPSVQKAATEEISNGLISENAETSFTPPSSFGSACGNSAHTRPHFY